MLVWPGCSATSTSSCSAQQSSPLHLQHPLSTPAAGCSPGCVSLGQPLLQRGDLLVQPSHLLDVVLRHLAETRLEPQVLGLVGLLILILLLWWWW